MMWFSACKQLCILIFITVCYLRLCTSGDIAYIHISRESITESRGCRLPQQVRASVRVDNENLTLELTRNADVDSNAPLYLIKDAGIEEKTTVVKEMMVDNERKAEYQDVPKDAAMTISCFGEDTNLHLQLRGILTLHGKEYQLEPKSRDRRETPRDEEEYVLEKQPVTFADDDYIEILSLEDKEPKSPVPVRDKRETTDYYIDVLTVVDYSVYQREYNRTDSTLSSEERKSKTLQNIREYFAYVMNGVNLRYKRITGLGFSLVIRLTGYVVADTRDKSTWTENNVTMTSEGGEIDSSVAVRNLRSWVASTSLPENDHVMLFSGYIFYRIKQNVKKNSYLGITYMSQMCRSEDMSTSVIQDHGGFQSIHTATHELGHSLGARHDGDGNNCNGDDQYIMSAKTRTRTDPNNTNHWTFSNCSLTYFTNYMTSLMNTENGRKCLTEKVTKDKVPSVDNFPGQKYSPDVQCQKLHGPKSKVCRGLTFDPDYSRVCFILYCLKPDDGWCYNYEAARGTTCGNKKWCINGLCVSSPNAPSVDETCPFGDEPGVVYKGKTCEDYISGSGSWRCYYDYYRKRCCHSCGLHYTGIPDCLYGDKTICYKEKCGKGYSFKNNTIAYETYCCKTCAPETTTITTTTETTTSTTTEPTTSTTNEPTTSTTTEPTTISTTEPTTSTTTEPTTSTTTEPTTSTTTQPTTSTTTESTTSTTTEPTTSTTTEPTTSTTTEPTTRTTTEPTTSTTTEPTTSTTTEPTTSTTTETTSTTTETTTSTTTETTTSTTTEPTTSTTTETTTSTTTEPTTSTTTEPTTSTTTEPTTSTTESITTTKESCFDVGYFEGLNCSQYVDMNGSFVCYESRVEKECCAKCASVATSVEGCKYGDRDPRICRRVTSQWIGCLVENTLCCMSCEKASGASTLQASCSTGLTTFLASIFLLYKQVTLQD